MNAVNRAKARFTIINRLGLHARAAAQMVKLASTFPCEVTVGHDGQTANAKSVMGVLLLCGAPGTVLDVEAVGEKAADAVSQIGELIENRFGEPD
jgi:phosphocarrier protein